ncbi:Intramembrane protease RasP/YluC, implicated in cell division based on FtsL cleavage [hydrothermal vent metagenome]|uniref:Intramembrane protease RasP/YluC, implicated in cell division based on FtsL cleavage n=1 Tax=hydrothermal vent metagenome TaxID=652676 RepID=A0A3B0ZZ17_9ZZZZ
MLSIFFTIISFLIAIGILVAIHEFGHFWVARKLGVKVLRFSIGMGKPLWKKKFGKDDTEFVLAIFPIGGYVSMLNEQEGEVDKSELHRAFNRQAIWRRSLIVLAGPAFNFLFAFVAYWLIAVWGVMGPKAVISQLEPGSIAAQAGLERNMEIVSVEGWHTPTWSAVFQEILPGVVGSSRVNMKAKDSAGITRDYVLDLSELNVDRVMRHPRPFDALGIYLADLPAVVGKVVEASPAQKAGMQQGDQLISLGEKKINHWSQIGRYLEDKANKKIKLIVKRNGELIDLTITPREVIYDGRKFGQIGIAPDPELITSTSEYVNNQYGPVDAIGYSLHRTWVVSYVTLRAVGLIVTGEMSLTNISGPVTIAVVAGKSASIGLVQFILFLALVSISLGILNLLPIPVLDGGHFFYYIVEAIKGSPVSETVEAIGQRIGILLLVMLMILAFYNDIVRLAA